MLLAFFPSSLRCCGPVPARTLGSWLLCSSALCGAIEMSHFVARCSKRLPEAICLAQWKGLGPWPLGSPCRGIHLKPHLNPNRDHKPSLLNIAGLLIYFPGVWSRQHCQFVRPVGRYDPERLTLTKHVPLTYALVSPEVLRFQPFLVEIWPARCFRLLILWQKTLALIFAIENLVLQSFRITFKVPRIFWTQQDFV